MSGVPGRGGPPPKREGQRRRRNVGPSVDHATSDGELRGPELLGEHSEVGLRWYQALRTSGQAQFYEPSDWAAAELTVLAIDAFVAKKSAVMFQAIQSAWVQLLVTEGDRRRARLELEQAAPEGESGDVSWIDHARRRKSG